MFANKTPEAQNKLVDQAAASADQAIRSTQRAANNALNGMAGTAQDLRERASALAHQGVDAVRNRTHQLSEGAHRVADNTRSYVRDEPVKSLLIAAATGAALMALLGFLGGSRRRA